MPSFRREPLGFEAAKLLKRENMDPAMLALLPRGTRTITKARLKEINSWFGSDVKFPAVPIEQGAA